MDNREKLTKLLLVDFGVDLYPKADGRIEVPKYMIYTWGSNTAYISSDMCGNIFVSDDAGLAQEMVSVSVKVSHGRIRIPSSFLKKVGMLNKDLVAVFDGVSAIHIKQSNVGGYESLFRLLTELTDKQTDRLLNIMLGRVPRDDNYIPNMEVAEISTNNCMLPGAKLFLLSSDESKPTIFRPVGDPYKFRCCWVGGVPKLTHGNDTDNTSLIYAMPGIKRNKDMDDAIGFLLVDTITFGKVCYVMKKKLVRASKRDLIFLFSPRARIGSFKVFENPDEEIDDDLIKRSKLICSNPERFLSDNFELFDRGTRGQAPLTITVNTMKKGV